MISDVQSLQHFSRERLIAEFHRYVGPSCGHCRGATSMGHRERGFLDVFLP
jgi:hypothetical protein